MDIKDTIDGIVGTLRRHKYNSQAGPVLSSFDDLVVVDVSSGTMSITGATLQQPNIIIEITRWTKLSGQRSGPRSIALTDFIDVNNPASVQRMFADPDNRPTEPELATVGVQPIEFAAVSKDRYVGISVRCRLVIVK